MSSLLEHGFSRTAAVEKVVAPIASHLCLLVLLCDSAEEPDRFSQLETAAQAVARATENMAAVASRYVPSEVMTIQEGHIPGCASFHLQSFSVVISS